MVSVIKEEIEDLQFLGGIFVEIEQQYSEADYSNQLDAFLPVLEGTHKKQFSAQSSPSGQRWPALAPSTIKRKGHNRILFESGRLEKSLTTKSGDAVRSVGEDGRGLLFGTSVPYSVFHNLGKGQKKREHVGLVTKTLDSLVNNVADHTVEEMKARA